MRGNPELNNCISVFLKKFSFTNMNLKQALHRRATLRNFRNETECSSCNQQQEVNRQQFWRQPERAGKQQGVVGVWRNSSCAVHHAFSSGHRREFYIIEFMINKEGCRCLIVKVISFNFIVKHI